MINSPHRYFLDAPKEQPGTCFVLDDDYMELWKEYQEILSRLSAADKCGCHHSVGCKLAFSASDGAKS